jgi:hypothetical protein
LTERQIDAGHRTLAMLAPGIRDAPYIASVDESFAPTAPYGRFARLLKVI